MRAVYECKDNPCLTLSIDEVLPLVEVQENTGGGVSVVWMRRNVPESLQFLDGTLTLTDPQMIGGMREYIRRRHIDEAEDFITELSFEGSEAELEPVYHIDDPAGVMSLMRAQGKIAAQEVIAEAASHKVDRSDEWDHIMEKRLNA